MNKAELIEALAQRSGLQKQKAKKYVGRLCRHRNRSYVSQ